MAGESPPVRRHPPLGPASGSAPWLYRFLISGVLRFLARWIFAIHVELRSAENLPRDAFGRRVGGWIAAPVPHVSWADPLMVVLALPVEPRLSFFGVASAIFQTRFRRMLFRLIGGVVPIWPGGGPAAFNAHIAAAHDVLSAGSVFVIYPESARYHPPPDQPRTIEPGFGYLALRTDALIVPLILGGTPELYRGRRLVVDVQPARSASELAGLPAGTRPLPGSREEREAAHRIANAFNELTFPLVVAQFREDEARQAHDRRTWPWLTHWLDTEEDTAAHRWPRPGEPTAPAGR